MDSRLLGLGRFSAVGVVAIALATVGGCSKKAEKSESTSSGVAAASATSTSSAGQPGYPELCKLFTAEEMAAVTGGKIASSHAGEKSTPTQPECDWLDPNEGIAVSISLSVGDKASLEGYEAVAGIGEAATENHGILTVLHHGTEITVIHGGTGQVETQKKIAAKVIEALDKKRQGQ